MLSLRLLHAGNLPAILQGWRINDPCAGGGVIPYIPARVADLARFLPGQKPEFVVAQSAARGSGQGVKRSAMSGWTMPSGAMVQSHESFTDRFAGSGVELHSAESLIFAGGSDDATAGE